MSSNDEETETENYDQKSKKRYCDKNFKVQLAKALKANAGEPENLGKIRSNRLLMQYESDRIIEYTNDVSEDVQKHVEQSIKDPRIKEIFTISKVVDDISGSRENKPQEIPLLLKLNASSISPGIKSAEGINFHALHRFLHSAVSGFPDYVDLNDASKALLNETYKKLMQEVEQDAPTVLEMLKTRSSSELPNEIDINTQNIAEIMTDSSLNPFSLPMEYLLSRNK